MLAYIRNFSVFCTEVNIILIIDILLIFIDKKQTKQLVYLTFIKENTSEFTCNKQKQAYMLAISKNKFFYLQ